MPRTARLDAPGVLHHVMIRGIERRDIFRNDNDRDDLIERLAKLLPDTNICCYAWAFLPNHAHFLFRTGVVGLATLMRRLLTGYAGGFNRRHQRTGHLFQNRYKSIICQEDVYLKELVRYIHLNPLRAGVVPDLLQLDKYPYSGHSAMMGRNKGDWHDTDYILAVFGKRMGAARKAYREFIKAGVGQGRREELAGGGLIRSLGGWEEVKKQKGTGGAYVMSDERILGESEFVSSVLSQAKEQYERRYELKRRGYDLNRITDRVVEIFGLEKVDLTVKSQKRRKVQARSLLCFWAVRELGFTRIEIAKCLGMTAPGVGFAVERGEKIARENGYELIES